MKPEFVSTVDIVSRLGPGVCLVSGNQRLAQAWQTRFDQVQIEQGLKAWESVDILPWHAWLKRNYLTLHHRLEPVPVLLSSEQENLLWEQIVAASGADNALLQAEATARQCAKAWELVHAWQLDSGDFRYGMNEDSRTFLHWCDLFRQRCAQQSLTTRAQIPDLLGQQASIERLALPEKLILSGFDELTPQQIALLQVIQQQSCQVEWLEKQPIEADIGVVKFEHGREEIESIARWTRAIHEREPHASVAIVVPQLSELKTVLQVIFDRVLMPQSLQPDFSDVHRPYNISLGKPLNRYPLVQIALVLLRFGRETIALEELAQVLRSPFIGGWEQERFARARLERHLREYATLEISFEMMMRCAADSEAAFHCPILHELLKQFRNTVSAMPIYCSTVEWSRHFAELLSAMQFAKGRVLSSEEYQAVEAWKSILGLLLSMGYLGSRLKIHQATRILAQLAAEKIFQARSEEVNIHILGVMEVNSLEFDYLWVIGMHDAVWPPAPRPCPFIPTALQRDKMMPHASARRELAFATQITERLAGNAGVVRFSYASHNQDSEQRPSPLLDRYRKVQSDSLELWDEPLWQQRIFAASELEYWQDSPVPLAKDDAPRGGSLLFKLQALCPFRAFAELRMDARAIDEAGLGLDPAQRGSLLHQVMEYFWSRVNNQQTLAALSESERDNIILECIERSLKRHEQRGGVPVVPGYRQLERDRLLGLVREWLQGELYRQNFSVLATEQAVDVQIKQLPVSLKVDRIDVLENGDRVVVDYKTGKVSPSQWFGERPEDPQLPLYSLALPEKLAGLVFAQVRAGETGFSGITREADVIKGVKSSEQQKQAREVGGWDALMAQWRDALEKLAEAYQQGYAVVDPLKYPASCQYCRLSQLCRVASLLDSQDLRQEDV